MAVEQQAPIFGDRYYEGAQVPYAPLIRVLAQVRWPNFANHETRFAELVRVLSESLGNDYPRYEEAHEVQLLIGPNGVMPQQAAGPPAHKYSSAQQDWTVTVASTFVVLETTAYTRRSEFIERFSKVLEAVANSGQIPLVSRIGYRYTNRIDDPTVYETWSTAINPTLRGFRGLPLTKEVTGIQSVGETLLNIGDRNLMARWALLPPGVALEPTIPVSTRPSWVLDLDSYRDLQMEFDTQSLLGEAGELAWNAYQFFRSVVSDELLSPPGEIS